MYQKWHMIL